MDGRGILTKFLEILTVGGFAAAVAALSLPNDSTYFGVLVAGGVAVSVFGAAGLGLMARRPAE